MASTSTKYELEDTEETGKRENEKTFDGIQNAAIASLEINQFIGTKFSCLEKLDQLCVKKGIKLGLSQTDVHTEVYDSKNQKIFKAKEQFDQSYLGCCYSPDRWLDMSILDLQDEEILRLSRDKGTSCSWVSCNLPTTEFFIPSKYKLGKMRGVTGIYPVKYNIEDEAGVCVFKIRSGFSFPYLYFNILSKDKSSIIGKISRERPESHHVFSRYYSVHISFPIDLHLKMKAVLLGVALLLMSSHFEGSE